MKKNAHYIAANYHLPLLP